MNIKIDALELLRRHQKISAALSALQDTDADVAIIGGGFSGINTALEFRTGHHQRGRTEARHLATAVPWFRNGGQVMAGIGHDIEAVKTCGKEG